MIWKLPEQSHKALVKKPKLYKWLIINQVYSTRLFVTVQFTIETVYLKIILAHWLRRVAWTWIYLDMAINSNKAIKFAPFSQTIIGDKPHFSIIKRDPLLTTL